MYENGGEGGEQMLGSNVPDMEVRGQLACPRVKRKHKKRSCESFMCPCVHIVSCTHDVYLYKSFKTPSSKGGLNVWNMNYWDKQHVAGWARTNRTKWGTCSSVGGAQYYLMTRPGWMYLRGATRISCSSMYRYILYNKFMMFRNFCKSRNVIVMWRVGD
jgi:hypothetical protein